MVLKVDLGSLHTEAEQIPSLRLLDTKVNEINEWTKSIINYIFALMHINLFFHTLHISVDFYSGREAHSSTLLIAINKIPCVLFVQGLTFDRENYLL